LPTLLRRAFVAWLAVNEAGISGMLFSQILGDDVADIQIVMLHGIYGASRNWFAIARQLVASRADIAVHLVDLRGHGRSPTMDEPHTLRAAAADVAALIDEQIGEPVALLGHSFGGKVAMRLAMDRPDLVERLIVVDASPAVAEPGGVPWEMLEVLASLPGPFDSREAAISELESSGVPAALAQWLAMNMQRQGDGYVWRFDVAMLRSLLRDYYASDTWPALESSVFPRLLVRASRESVIDNATWARLEAVARSDPKLTLRELAGGHWLHVENPRGLLDVLNDAL
jgi:pimeloyl-ACP methyl ester carboxylesterase